jgi:hypothetical protein
MANGDLAMFKALSVGRPWVLGIQNQVVSYCGVGLCDPLLQNSVSALEPFRYATCLFAWSLVATQGPNGSSIAAGDDGANLQIPTQQEREIFVSGVGEPMPGGWWIQTISDTDLFRSGAPVDRGFMFLVTGVTFNALDVFQRGGSGALPDDPKNYSNWLQESHNGPGYGFIIQKFHINYTAMQFTFGDTGCSYRIGVGGFWPTWGDPSGAQTVRNGLVATPGMYLPFTTAVCIGARDDVRQLTITLTTGQSGLVQSNPAHPTIAGSKPATAGTINGKNDGTVYAPVRVVAVGYIICVPYADYCGIPTLTPDEVMLLRARLGLQPVGAPVGGSPMMLPGTQLVVQPGQSNIPTPG